MEISFFEEFPNAQSLAKLKLLTDKISIFPNDVTKIYIAAHSLDEFRHLENKVSQFPWIRMVYWIVLKKWEGYWISPFSARWALLRVLNEVREESIEVMLDLENPVHALWLYFFELPNFQRNKRFISDFIEYRSLINAPTYLVELSGDDNRLKFWGLHYEPSGSDAVYIVKMVYTSLKKLKIGRERSVLKLREVCETGVARYGSRFKIGLGCIGTGIAGWEPLLSEDELLKDLSVAKEVGVREAIIFRLGGLNENYIKVIKEIISP